MTLTAQSMMNRHVITARPDMTCEEVQELLVANRISGAPVVDETGCLVGLISMSDILNTGLNLAFSPSFQESDALDRALESEGFHLESITEGFVSDFMTRRVITATPETAIEALAEIMYKNRIHRVVIVDARNQQLCGIVTTFDLLKAFTGKIPARPTA